MATSFEPGCGGNRQVTGSEKRGSLCNSGVLRYPTAFECGVIQKAGTVEATMLDAVDEADLVLLLEGGKRTGHFPKIEPV